MKFLIQAALTAAICFVLQYFLPWWTLAIGAMGVGYGIGNKPFIAFLAGFVGAALLWSVMSYYSEVTTHAILSNKVDQLLPARALLLATIIGGLVGGFAGMTGATLRTPPKR